MANGPTKSSAALELREANSPGSEPPERYCVFARGSRFGEFSPCGSSDLICFGLSEVDPWSVYLAEV